MKIAVIGGTGHVGVFMVPMLIAGGHEVVVIGSGKTPLPKKQAWSNVKYIVCNVAQEDEIEKILVELPEVVIDMTGAAWNIYHKLKIVAKHIIVCGSLWMYGEPKTVPTPEETQNDCPFDGYRKRYAEILKLIDISKNDGVSFTAIMPPNICGPGKVPIDCLGGRNIELHKMQASGEEVILPDGPDVLIGPCDAEDIADCFVRAVANRGSASGQIFNVGSGYALTASQFVQVFADIYNVEIPIKRVSWDEYISSVSPGIGYWWHFKSHMCPDISKARKLLGYNPCYTPQQTIARAVDWMCRELSFEI